MTGIPCKLELHNLWLTVCLVSETDRCLVGGVWPKAYLAPCSLDNIPGREVM